MSHEHLTEPVPQWIWEQYHKLSSEKEYKSLLTLETIIQSQCSASGVSKELAELLRLLGLDDPPKPSESRIVHNGLYSGNVKSIFEYEAIESLLPPEWAVTPTHSRTFPDPYLGDSFQPYVLEKDVREVFKGSATVNSEIWSDGNDLVVDRLGRFSPDDLQYGALTGTHELFPNSEPEYIPGSVLFLAYPLAAEWGHFWEQIVTRLLWASRFVARHADSISLLLPAELTEPERQIIDSLVPEGVERIYRSNGHLIVAEKLLIIPCPNLDIPVITHGSRLDRYRNPFLPSDAINAREVLSSEDDRTRPTKRVFFSRRTSNQRTSCLFEEVLSMYLGSRGFEEVDLGSLTLQEQKKLVSNARYSIGMQGSWVYTLNAFAPPQSQHFIFVSSRSQEFKEVLTAIDSTDLELTVSFVDDSLVLPFYSEHHVHGEVKPTVNALRELATWVNSITD